ncbi:dTDP-4-dehydrorhamnose 3,5-epimerase [Natronoflexus pectinivorans]|uniref:dTDP-4-dehydrorhamnose 3,5-epimerase n=1 Tax=Natronoflexus pectinivorans TaxID=682526 RepID=A0A4R2GI66_9BACT|nr:dTDP-4-dehydrorhamnose 3,5-epimerase [Natronoflexus pectinivorans]TCO07881.1 dTDP-4-dehydrorhamnose 3,5-epimerase [Natronoflexus pectinivorans]
MLEGLVVIEPSVFKDNRGCFFESYNAKSFLKQGIKSSFVQDNISISSYGVIRGLHYQEGEHAQAKLVQVLKGRVLDVVVDLRPWSKSYGEVFSIELSETNRLQLYIPRGFAHGFSVLSEEVLFHYKCDNYYNKESESGIVYTDPELNIDWGIPKDKEIISDKDLALPFLEHAEKAILQKSSQ